MTNKATTIFKKGSKTYYFSSIFFPPNTRDKVTNLYAYVRTIDDFVDTVPADIHSFFQYKEQTVKGITNNEIIAAFLKLAKDNNFQRDWYMSFLHSMELDIHKTTYESYKELEEYIYGSANVIGYMMAAIMDLPKGSFEYAGLQGKAMQLINFIRDIKEDIDLGRTYIPQEDLRKFKLQTIQPTNEQENEKFISLIRYEIERYFSIQKDAEKGYKYIPKKYLIPIQTAAQMYYWTAKEIYKNPLIVFEKKLKPSKLRIFAAIIKHSLTI